MRRSNDGGASLEPVPISSADAPLTPIPTDAPPPTLYDNLTAPRPDYSLSSSDRNSDLMSQFNASDKPVPYPAGTMAIQRNDDRMTRVKDFWSDENKGIPQQPMYDSEGKITEQGRRELASVGPHVAVAEPSPAVPHPSVTQTPPVAPTKPAEDDLLAKLLNGGGGSGGAKWDPFANRKAAMADAQKREDELRDMRQDAGRFNASEVAKEANAMDRYSREAKARGESQSEEARGKEAAFINAAEEAAKDRIDPNRLMANKTTLEKGFDLFGSIFGGALAGRKGGPNQYLEQLNQNIARDIDAQKENHRIKSEGVQAKQIAYGMMLDRFKNDSVWKNAEHAAELDKWKALGDARAALDTNVQAQADWAKMRDAIDEKRAEYADAAAKAAHAPGVDVLAQYKKYLDVAKEKAEIEKTQADTAKLNRDATKPDSELTPEQRGQKAMAKEEVTGNLQGIESAKRDVGSIVAGTSVGGAASHLPAWVPGAATAKQNVSNRETYNDTVRGAIGAAYRLQTGSPEPRNMELIERQAEPFEIKPTDDEATARQKMDNLERYLQTAGVAKGVDSPNLYDSARASGPAQTTPGVRRIGQ